MFLKRGSRGELVKTLQNKLKTLGYYLAIIDGDFGPITEKAVRLYQIDKKLNADGVVGNITWKSLFGSIIETVMPTIIFQSQMRDLFGDPTYSGWAANWLSPMDIKQWDFPPDFPDRIWVNKVIISPLTKIFTALENSNLLSEIKTYNGCHNVRKMKAGGAWSTHSWAFALDLNANENAFGGEVTFSEKFINMWSEYGWEPGAIWTGRYTDGMHFQWCWTRDWRVDTSRRAYMKPKADLR